MQCALRSYQQYHRSDDAVAFAITETEFPLPGFELVPGIGEFAQIALQATSKVIVIGGNLKCAQSDFERAVTHTGSELGARRRRAGEVEHRSRGISPAVGRVVRHRKWV